MSRRKRIAKLVRWVKAQDRAPKQTSITDQDTLMRAVWIGVLAINGDYVQIPRHTIH